MCKALSTDSPTSSASRIMVVDDDHLIRDVVTRILPPPEFTVVAACGARECLDHLHQGFRGVILMDVTMPDVNGWDTIREIEQAGMLSGNVIVMLTGTDPPDERMEGLQEVVIDYITKPFSPTELVTAVRKYCAYLVQAGKIGSKPCQMAT